MLFMEYANWTIEEIRDYEQRPEELDPVPCGGCAASRKLMWVKRPLGGRSSGSWQWSLIYPYHAVVQRKNKNN